MSRKTQVLVVLATTVLIIYLLLNPSQFLSFEQLKAQQQLLLEWKNSHPVLAASGYFVSYVLIAALSLPGAAIMTLAGGALFGLVTGSLLVSFASTLGATLALLLSRYLLRDWVSRHFGRRMAAINAGVERDGGWYLLSLRLVPVFPFFLVNLLTGLTRLPVHLFYWVSQLGMLPATLVYVNAGTQLATIHSPADIATPTLLASLLLLGILPLVTRRLLQGIQARRVYRGWQKPSAFDRNLIVIGAGAGGLVTAYIAAAIRSSVTLIERDAMGGDCLNTGCVPSKTLIRAARYRHQLTRAAEFGFAPDSVPTRLPAVMARVQQAIAAIEPHDSVERYSQLGVDCIHGEASLLDPWTVEIRQGEHRRRLTARSIVIASGGRPRLPDLPGIDEAPVYTSESLWQLSRLPQRLVVLGGGAIGCEMAQAFARLGSEVTLLEQSAQILPRDDEDARELVMQSLAEDGIKIHCQAVVERIETRNGRSQLIMSSPQLNGRRTLPFDAMLCAIGRVGNSEGLGLDALGIERRENGQIVTNDYLQTRFPHLYAVGDVTGPYQFTHAASHQAWYAAVNALFAPFRAYRADYRLMPRATFTDPECAVVGLTEQDAVAQNIDYEITRYPLAEHDRAITEQEARGFIKVLTIPGKDTILGATIVGYHASELISHYVLAMKYGLGMNKLMGTIHLYPAMSEAIKLTAGRWKQAHAPTVIYPWLERYHRWRRGT